MSAHVQFHFVDLEPFPLHENLWSVWLNQVALAEEFLLSRLTIQFCSDDYLLEMNKTHLDHDYYTDIITFDSSKPPILKGELYISWDRVKENALGAGVKAEQELERVMVHGLLHLMGYGDKSEVAAAQMREKEEWALCLRAD
ncbi:MAG: rRNA maturation RNase YbeY [Bacteroidetes bacterium]|nr:rRNA maturation RNase YbeY [Bacteroidota bacterium]